MAYQALKCPKCGHEEGSYSSRPHEPPPCPRCPTFIRMEVKPPPPAGEQSGWSSGGSK